MFFTLGVIGEAFCELDKIKEGERAPYDRFLRNLVQRQYLPPSRQQGRIFIYDRAAAATIRLAYAATICDLSRLKVDALCHWLKEPWGSAGASPIDAAVARVLNGETFALFIITRADHSIGITFDRPDDLNLGEMGILVIPASRIIGDVIKALEGRAVRTIE